jgi:uncharacterized protein DUF262/uncharacterized protein DUF1524
MDANAVSVLDIFEKKHRLEIPLFQRQYVWNEEHQWAPLWEDIARKTTEYLQGRKDGPVHFLGAMVVDQKQTPTTSVDKRQVIDGQQRLTTLQIFLAALRDFCRAQGCEEIAAELDVLTKNRGRMVDPDTECYKVWPTQRDRDQFRDVMDAGSKSLLEQKHPLRKLPRRRKYEPRPRMVEAYIFFYRQISEYFLGAIGELPLGHDRSLEDRLDDALNALKAALQVVVIDLGQGDDAKVIFETLNARGEPLLPADLLRNYIFLRAARRGEPQDTLYEQHWKPFDDPFWRQPVRQGRLIRPRSDLFMQHYLSSRQFNDVPVSHLFVEYKYWIDSKRPFETVAAELEALAKARDNYKKFLSSPATTSLGAFSRFLDSFDVGTIHPLMMVIAEATPSDDELDLMLQSLESYLVRRTVCGLPTKAYNRVFLGLASGLSQHGVTSQTLRDPLSTLAGDSSVWPRDDSFSAAFLTRAGYYSLSQSRVLHILKRLNESFYSTRSEKVSIQSDLWVEHLMPQKWQQHWPLADGSKGLTVIDRLTLEPSAPGYAESAERDRVVQSIGNLTLLTQQLNISISNGPWADKRRKIAEHSVLPLNQMAATLQAWDENVIKSRAQELLNRALVIWHGPPTPVAAVASLQA